MSLCKHDLSIQLRRKFFHFHIRYSKIYVLFQVFYNNVNILKRAKERMLHVTSVNIAWSCSPEFDASQEQGISFLDDHSYVMLAKPVVQTGER